MSDYDIGEELGCGTSARVFKAFNRKTREFVALKVFNRDFDDDEERERYENEVYAIARFHHETILMFKGYSLPDSDRERPTIATELMSDMTLYSVLDSLRKGKGPKVWGDGKKCMALYGVARGMMYLHSQNVAHRDLKPANVMLSVNFEPKIGDFGVSKSSQSELDTLCGSPVWMAPELVRGELYTNKVDVWAYGIIVYEVITGKLPAYAKSRECIMKALMNGERPIIPDNVQATFRILMENCWAELPENRPTFAQIVDLLKPEDAVDFQSEIEMHEYETYKRKIRLRDLYDEGMALIANGEAREGADKVIEAAGMGLLVACVPAAKLYMDGIGCLKNETVAARYYKMAADSGDVEAQLVCGEFLRYGKGGVGKNRQLAKTYYDLAAAQGNIQAMVAAGELEARQPENMGRACEYFVRAANAGDLTGALRAGAAYEKMGRREAFDWYRVAVERGCVNAICRIGHLHELGIGIPRDLVKAREFYERAAGQGDQEAIDMLASINARMQPMEPVVAAVSPPLIDLLPTVSPERVPSSPLMDGLIALRRRADENDIYACYELANMLGALPCASDRERLIAARYMSCAALGGHTEAQYYCGQMLKNGGFVKRDYAKALYFFKLAATVDHFQALTEFMNLATSGVDLPANIPGVIAFLEGAANYGNKNAQTLYGDCLTSGVWMQVDEARAAQYYGRAASQGQLDALIQFGLMSANGRGIEENRERAVECYRRAAAHNHVVGLYNLGVCLETGTGAEKNMEEAERCYKRAADAGYIDAQCNYALIKARLPKTRRISMQYAKMAAEQGHGTAQYIYGTLLADLDHNEPEAIRWCGLSAAQGNRRAREWLERRGYPVLPITGQQ